MTFYEIKLYDAFILIFEYYIIIRYFSFQNERINEILFVNINLVLATKKSN